MTDDATRIHPELPTVPGPEARTDVREVVVVGAPFTVVNSQPLSPDDGGTLDRGIVGTLPDGRTVIIGEMWAMGITTEGRVSIDSPALAAVIAALLNNTATPRDVGGTAEDLGVSEGPAGDDATEVLQRTEWEAWLKFVDVLKTKLGVDSDILNGPAYLQLFVSLRTWGEQLARLRREQPATVDIDRDGHAVFPEGAAL